LLSFNAIPGMIVWYGRLQGATTLGWSTTQRLKYSICWDFFQLMVYLLTTPF
jgi:hypothetical protein